LSQSLSALDHPVPRTRLIFDQFEANIILSTSQGAAGMTTIFKSIFPRKDKALEHDTTAAAQAALIARVDRVMQIHLQKSAA
jgi:hypothetical protein